MSETKTDKPQFKYVHGVYKALKDNAGDAVIGVVKNVATNESTLKIWKNPSRSIFVTKPGLRDLHDRKKEFAYKRELDEYKVQNYQLKDELKRLLGYKPNQFVKESDLLNSPYVYGASIDMDVIIKQSFANSTEKEPSEYRVGGLDIETSVLGGQEIQLCTYVSHEHKVFCAIHAAFLPHENSLENIKKITDAALVKFEASLNADGKKVYQKYRPQIEYYVTRNELDLIKWIMANIHKEKDDFISVWNMNFDIPYILNRLKFFNANPFQIMCHPDVPWEYRVCKFIEDKSELIAHYSHRWHMFELSGYTQFYDSMALYSRLRKVDGNLTSYKLKDISSDVIGASKLDFGEAGHHEMQRTRFEEYCAYNIVDALLLPIMEKVINDVSSMLLLIPLTSIGSFAKQTAQLMDIFHDYCRRKGAVSASCKGSLEREYDSLIKNVGGAVLSPLLARGTGTKKVKEMNKETGLCALVSDLDVVSFYPNMNICSNISRQTKKANMLTIEGRPPEDIVDFFGHAAAPQENAVALCSKFFNLPGYEEMLTGFMASRG
jgi:DNA polymerase elongation subunit (family B)